MPSWYTRPVFFITDLPRSLHFYLDTLGFTQAWARDDVAQVQRGDCEIILFLDPARAGHSRLFLELLEDELTTFKAEFQTRSIPTRETHWGYPCIEIRDPDGNELLIWQGEQSDSSQT
jgi:catechol 2,3-dioxygenase-like lactoylglutathione lyase family enzyme